MTWLWIVLAIVLVVLIGLGLWELGRRRRRTERLREHFGHEYDAAVAATGSRKRGEEELEAREERRQELDIRPLPDQARRRYRDRWRGVQERFVDAPNEAVAEADGLIGEVMRERGYPLETFEQRAADISVDHPDVVENYRAAHAIATKDEGDGRATTEELRQAMVHYRALFDELLRAGGDGASPTVVGPARQQAEREASIDDDADSPRPVVREESRIRRIDEAAEADSDPAEAPGATTKRGAS